VLEDGSSGAELSHEARLTRRPRAILYVFLVIATLQIVGEASYLATKPSVQVVFRNSLNGASYAYLRCHQIQAAVSLSLDTVEPPDETMSDNAPIVELPGSNSAGRDTESSLQDDPVRHESRSRSRDWRESRGTSWSRSHARSDRGSEDSIGSTSRHGISLRGRMSLAVASDVLADH
jgi:hypothetical protein